ncbi:putative disease resistance protein RGA4 [Tripterygium wilfordii]|uniref:putative disease resistance protein RGA4 n=1 Tax=Tripterygium wilfordii TaxID=458696 RepID=UPI0018F84852|nr:putative disease resistance protein RGA4 [Tripterygium wilfordii]
MAEAILFNLSGKILESLGSVLLQELGSLFHVKDELARLEHVVSAIKVKLLDAEEQSRKSNEVEHWLKELKYVLYDVDDLLDAYSTKILQRNAMSGHRMTKEVRIFFSHSNQFADRVKISREIKFVKEKLDDIAKNMSSFNFREQNSEARVENFRREQTHSFIDASDIIGRGHDKERVIKLLSEVNENESVSTVAVVGLGGLGKTTLAQLVFNDDAFSADFELKMWVHVSDIFDVKTIVEKILVSKSGELEMETLQQELRKKIDGKKYLLVLDDLWNEDLEDWLKLKILLAGGARGSRILVTTRSAKAAASTQSFRSYELKGLNEDDSWSLFSKMVLGQRNESEASIFQDIGREIVKKCVGVPLAIRSIGRLLYFKMTESEWLRVKNEFLANANLSIRKDLQVLKLSYDHLPSHLKHCFAYCSLFPKGYLFYKKNVIQLWIAQGFVQSSWDDQRLEDAGDEYFSELLWRSFFQDAKKDYLGNIWGFEMHDLMCDLAQLVAGTECSLSTLDAKIVDARTRHVSSLFISSPSSSSLVFPIGLLKANRTRTLLLPVQSHISREKRHSNSDTIFSTLRCLRTLDLRYFKFKSLSDSIGKLKHLRYLRISGNDLIEQLPSCIWKLQNLQTLILSYCSKLLELPSEITKIASLRHIEIDGCHSLKHMPHGLGKLSSLQTLSLFVVGNSQSSASRQGAGLWELNMLNNLRETLVIRQLENAAIALNTAYLKEKEYLQSLSLCWSDKDNVDVDVDVDESEMLLEALRPHPNLKKLKITFFGGLKIPNWISSLRNVVSIKLVGCKRCQHIPKLDHLLSLKELTLTQLHALEYISDSMTTSTTFFPSLEELILKDCGNMRGWWRAIDVEIPQFQRLSQLEIENCPKLTSMPLFPFVTYLKLKNASPKPLQQTLAMLKMNMAAAPSKMLSFHVSQVEDLKSHLDQWLQCFPSLHFLSIFDCPGLTFLPRHLKHLCSLKILYLVNAEDLDPSSGDDKGEDFQWQHLTSLDTLSFSGLPKMLALPSALQHVTTLQRLTISSCPTLKDLPTWLPNLNALHILEVEDCPELKSMPDGMPRLTSLRELEIRSCGQLSKRCRKNEGEDWPKIAHVPVVFVDGERQSLRA